MTTIDAALTLAREAGFELYLLFGSERIGKAKAVLTNIAASKRAGYYSSGQGAVRQWATRKTEVEAILAALHEPDNHAAYVHDISVSLSLEELGL